MKKLIYFIVLIAGLSFLFAGCEKDSDKGTLKLHITDAPIDSDNITGVYIKITDIQYHKSGNEWESFENFIGPQTYNLLDLTRGESELLGNLELEAGLYTQLRFILDAPVYGTGTPSNPGSYLEFADGNTTPLFVPSGYETGFKGVGAFTVPLNGEVEVTADFDVRKSVVEAGVTGMYILKPTIRLVVNNQAGKIVGGVINIPENSEIVIYAYVQGSYSNEEANEPAIETPRFPNAISSDRVDENGSYHIDFLAPETYELVVVKNVDGSFVEVLGVVPDVVVESKKTTTVSIDIEILL